MSKAIICDVCGKRITKDYKFLIIKDAYIDGELHVITPKYLDVCHDCWKKAVGEVVRCKDCEHHEELLYNNDGKVLCRVHGLDVVVDRNGYCNYGERKEREHESNAETD